MTIGGKSSLKTLEDCLRNQILGQSLIGIIAAIVLYQIAKTPNETTLLVPFFKDLLIPLGLGYIIPGLLCHRRYVQCGESDGWTRRLSYFADCFGRKCLGVFAYLTGNAIFSQYLFIPTYRGPVS